MKQTNLKKYAMGLMLGTGLMGMNAVAHAADDVSVFADIGVFSQYLFRGIPQSINNDASVQGDVGVEHESGVSANVWFATGLDFGTGSETEYDITIDYSGEAGDIGYSVGYIMYKYVEDSTLDVEELYVGASYDIASLTAYIGDGYNYYQLSAGDTVADMVDVSVTAAMTSPDSGSSTNHFILGVSKDFDMSSYTLSPSLTVSKVGDASTEVAVGVNASF
ncbi:MAG: hypothetical protein AUK35_10760 [Zetaproteobacteria bacterium CG2_30_46_52]|nr:MAG: hypothetical protein AUK35_10760 [Zetaproteobacteria bacterium CG2_30_46_52]